MDPETLYGCEETGETRYAVTRRLGKLWEPGMQVYLKDPLDHLWKMAEVVEVSKEHKTCKCSLVAVDELIEVDWDNMKPFDVYATSRPMALSDPVRGELAEGASRFTYFENLKQTDPVRFEQEWYQHICTKYAALRVVPLPTPPSPSPSPSQVLQRRGAHRFFPWLASAFHGLGRADHIVEAGPLADGSYEIHAAAYLLGVRWTAHALSASFSFSTRHTHRYPVRAETFEFGPDGKEEPWWVQHRPHHPNPKKAQKK